MTFKTALVVDDEKVWQDTICRQLERGYQGIQVTKVGSVDEAKEKVSATQLYDLYTLDGLNGKWKDVAEHVKFLQSDAKMVLFSGDPENHRADAEKLGIPTYDKIADLFSIIPRLEEILA